MPELVLITRQGWGASASTEEFIRNRVRNRAEDVTSIHVHHTAAIDVDDSTPNRWDYDEAVAYMRKLQWSRPDLGPLPYNDNIAISEDLQTVWLFEGRGPLVRGAHTAGYNTTGYGIGILGNFDKNDPEAAKILLWAIERRVYDLRTKHGLVNLGKRKSPKGWNAWGHRDSSSKSCPGNYFYPLLESFSLDRKEDEMALTPAEEKVVKDMARALGQVNSSGYFAREAVALIRKERDLPLHPAHGMDEDWLRQIIREEIAAARIAPQV